jgi:long-chain acyl-CoA synthetase
MAGDRVAIAMKNAPEYSEIMFGAWHAGLATVPMNARLHPREFAYILVNSGAKICFVSEDMADGIAEAAKDVPTLEHIVIAGSARYHELLSAAPAAIADVAADDLAWLFYTSGTTGRPKGAMLTHKKPAVNERRLFSSMSTRSRLRIASSTRLPTATDPAFICCPCRTRCLPGYSGIRGFDPDEVFALLRVWKGATFFFAPTMVTRLINAPGLAAADTSTLKTIVYGGAPMYAEDCLKALDLLGPKLVQIYGQGESPMTITALSRAVHIERDHPHYHDRLASVGPAQKGVEVRITDEEDNDLPLGEIGEILVRGDVVMKGYWQNPDATSASLRGGWLHTGDMGALDKDGFLTLKDRSKDVIISGGSNIYPREVEEILLRHDGVLECSVIGRPHPDWGEEIIAFVVPKPDAEVRETDLDELCLEHIARFKRPKAYRMIDALPKNNYGKVLKTDLRNLV